MRKGTYPKCRKHNAMRDGNCLPEEHRLDLFFCFGRFVDLWIMFGNLASSWLQLAVAGNK